MRTTVSRNLGLLAAAALLLMPAVGIGAEDGGLKRGQRVAVVTFSQTPEFERFGKTLQTTAESTLADNGLSVLDLAKAEELRSNWDQLEDPTSFITAEDFVARAEKFEVDAVLTLYYTVDVREVMGDYYSATANLSARVVSSEADVKPGQGPVMGTLGYAPSDGATASAAVVNALRRELDRVSESLGLEVLAPERAQYINVELVPVPGGLPAGATPVQVPSAPSAELVAMAPAQTSSRARNEEVSCSASAPGKSAAVAATYTRDIDLQRGRASFGSSLVLLDPAAQRRVNEIVFHDMLEGRGREGAAKVTGCLFFNGWRFVLAASERELKLFDVEQGREAGNYVFHPPLKEPTLALYEAGPTRWAVVVSKGERQTLALRPLSGRP